MRSFSANSVVLVEAPFSSLTGSKVRPAVVINSGHPSEDIIIVPLTSRTSFLMPGEFVLGDWSGAGLNVESAVKRGIYTVAGMLVRKTLGRLSNKDASRLEASVKGWLCW